ncbi:MAG: hypothetical protein Q8O37_01510 [Sulfuricellaceae bacterium]|nr:hypothetical protein [Sulfuricellaceae bacterium]
MFRNHSRFFILILLALLQCFAPLLHAHTHDVPATIGVHLHDLDGRHDLGLAAPDVPTFLADHGDVQVIAMVHEFRQDSSMEVVGADRPILPAYSLASGVTVSFLLESTPASLPWRPRPHVRPLSQAPPASLIL